MKKSELIQIIKEAHQEVLKESSESNEELVADIIYYDEKIRDAGASAESYWDNYIAKLFKKYESRDWSLLTYEELQAAYLKAMDISNKYHITENKTNMKKSELVKIIQEAHREVLTELLYTPSDKDNYMKLMEALDSLILKLRNNKLVQASAVTKGKALKLATAFNELDIEVKDEIAKQR